MNKKRIVTAVTCCALVGAIAVGGTIALLTSNAHTLKNTFTIGNNYPENALTLKEHAVVRVTDANAETYEEYTFGDYAKKGEGDWVMADASGTKGNSYTDVIPGSKLDKDPQFTLEKGSPNSWIIAEVDGVSDLTSVGSTVDKNTLSDKWYFVEKPSEKNDNKYVLHDVSMKVEGTLQDGYYLYKADETGKVDPTTNNVVTDTLFTEMNVSANPTATSGDGLPLTVKGVAVQATTDMTLADSLQTVMTKVNNVLHPAP